jgi:PAS domain-containing protein
VAVARPKHLTLILAREFATSLATPMLVADDLGILVFYNEAVEEIVGRSFEESGETPLDDWMESFDPRPIDPDPMGDERRPTQIAFQDQRASHRRFRVTSVDGVERQVALTAFPLFAHADEFVGVVAIFWRE